MSVSDVAVVGASSGGSPPLVGMAWWRSIGSPRYVCAPMVDASELPFRMLCREFGTTLCYTPMMHSRLLVEQAGYAEEHFSTCAADRPLIAQLCGHDPAVVLAAARVLQDRGVDAIDLNLGCPQGIARRGRYGAFLLDEPETILAIVRALAGGLRVPVTCKIRVLATQEATLKLARDIEAAGASLLTVHGRQRANMKQNITTADWDIIAAIKRELKIPVIANGSIGCFADVEECLRLTGVDGVMSSEALLENPGLFAANMPTAGPLPSAVPANAFALSRRYLEIARETNFKNVGTIRGHMFKFLFGVLRAFPQVMDSLLKAKTMEEVEAVVETALAVHGASTFADASRSAAGIAATEAAAAQRKAAGVIAGFQGKPLAWAEEGYLSDPSIPGSWYMRHRPDAYSGAKAPSGLRPLSAKKRARAEAAQVKDEAEKGCVSVQVGDGEGEGGGATQEKAVVSKEDLSGNEVVG